VSRHRNNQQLELVSADGAVTERRAICQPSGSGGADRQLLNASHGRRTEEPQPWFGRGRSPEATP